MINGKVGKAVILGGGTRLADEVKDLANEKGTEIWCLNAIRPHWLNPRKISKCFNLHRYPHLQRDWAGGLKMEAEWAAIFPEVPFYVIGPWPKKVLPNQIQFPRHKLDELEPNAQYHSSSIDMMLCLAWAEGFDEIVIHGINFQNETGEPISARCCLEYWIGRAQGAGVAVTVAEDCDSLFKQFHYVKSNSYYGYDDIHMVEDRT